MTYFLLPSTSSPTGALQQIDPFRYKAIQINKQAHSYKGKRYKLDESAALFSKLLNS
jgi:hypothetical protein